MYMCLICGYMDLHEMPYDEYGCASFEICSCCGFEFGFDDFDQDNSFDQYRREWISKGAIWFTENKKPEDWNLIKQLENLKK